MLYRQTREDVTSAVDPALSSDKPVVLKLGRLFTAPGEPGPYPGV